MTVTGSAFRLPDRLAPKAEQMLIAADERQFAAIAESLDRSIGDLTHQLDAERRHPAGHGQQALDRDLEVHRLSARLRTLRRFGIDLCLGRMVGMDGETVYIGRLGLTDTTGQRLLIDWRSPAAEPFFGATHANPMGLASRRRYRWTLGRISDYWDEIFTADGLDGHAALDDQSTFIASLGSSRSTRMRDVLGTVQADQDAIIRAGSRGALVVDGGPGTGKTVVALHRSAYLLYSDPRLAHGHGGVLFVGPSSRYLAYVDDVLPSLGEDGVQTCTLRDLVIEGSAAVAETDPRVAALKASRAVGELVERAVRYHERPPTDGLIAETPWADVLLREHDWREAFDSAEPGILHNDARDQVWHQLIEIVTDKLGADVSPALVGRALQSGELRSVFVRAWPLLDPAGVVADLWSVPAYLRRCAPWLDSEEVTLLQRPEPREFTTADLPVLDAARARIGDPESARRRRRQQRAIEAERERYATVIDDLIAIDSDQDGVGLVTMLRGEDAQNSLIDPDALVPTDPDQLAGPFAHIVVDEAQELTDAEWLMLLRRCPSRSFTIVGDRAQARRGFSETWAERLGRIGLDAVTIASLTINYRTPEEVMCIAEPVIRAAIPDANVPVSIRRSGIPVSRVPLADRDSVLATWLAEHSEGIACVIGDASFVPVPRVQSLTPERAKGLEFDLVLVADTAMDGSIESAVDRYVAMTRATQRLVLLEVPSATPW